jgi:hypothetical protein
MEKSQSPRDRVDRLDVAHSYNREKPNAVVTYTHAYCYQLCDDSNLAAMGRHPKATKRNDAQALMRVPRECMDAFDVCCAEHNTTRSKLFERFVWREFERLERARSAQLPLVEQKQLTFDDLLFNVERLKAVTRELAGITPGILEID